MWGPAFYALVNNSHAEARSFFYSGLLGAILTLLIGIARAATPRRKSLLHNLLAFFAAFTVLPIALAIPFHDALGTTSFVNAYVEMVSSITTTGATLFDANRLSNTLHLWRATVGWLGGLLIWIAAAAILAPLSLGGFEVTASAEPGQGRSGETRFDKSDPHRQIIKVTSHLTPVYVGLTLALWLLLVIGGDDAVVALCHAMSTLATSGISAVNGVENAASGVGGEAIIALFMLFALSRITFSTDTLTTANRGVFRDPEFRLGVLLVVGVSGLLFVRHWFATFTVNGGDDLLQGLRSLWGSVFTVLSFLSTTGFVSSQWEQTQLWSGLATPGIILMGLALVGGGVATTAGGVKLLRVWALYLNGLREIERLIHPNSMPRAATQNNRIRRKGARIAFVFFMLFAISLTVLMLVFAALGSSFEAATALAIAALSNTGPILTLGINTPISLIELSDASKLIFAAAMIVGRLETLAIIALLTSDLWRR